MLTSTQQSALLDHLRDTNHLTNEELILELIDHYSLALGEQMQQGIPFDTALTVIQRDFGGRSGMLMLEAEFVRAKNEAAWSRLRQIIQSYRRFPRLVLLLATVIAIYQLLMTYWQYAFTGLFALTIVSYIIAGLPYFGWKKADWQYDWHHRSFAEFFQKKVVGPERITNILLGITFGVVTNFYLFFFPFTFERTYEAYFPLIATAGLTLGLWVTACVAELTATVNPVLKRFV